VDTNIVYKHLAPGASSTNAITITTATRRIDSSEVQTIYSVGEIVTLQADDPEEFGDEPKEYKVQYRFPILTQFGEFGFSLSVLLVVVTDPNA
jgi:hypothetical protein